MFNSISLKLAFFTTIALTCATAPAQSNWPQKPIKVIVAYPAGSMGDSVIRVLSDDLRRRLGQPIIVENRAGAGGNIGTSAVAQANPDGYTLLLAAANNFASNQYLYKDMGFDPLKAFQFVSVLVDVPSVVFINASLPVKTFAEFATYAKANIGKLNYGSPGTGTPPHLAAESINQEAKLGLTHVPYKGSPFAVTALLSNEIQMMLAGAGVGAPHVKVGKLRAIAVGGSGRVSEFPDVPTLNEVGLGNVKASTWWGVAAPQGTPPEVVEKLNASFNDAMSSPALQRQLAELGAIPVGGKAEDMRKQVTADSRYWQGSIPKMGIKVD